MEQIKNLDAYIGQKIREMRVAKKLSLQKLAREIGIVYQQLQKYEKGENQIPAKRIHQISEILNIPESEFFPSHKTNQHNPNAHLLSDRHTLEVAQAFWEIKDKKLKQGIIAMVRKINEDNQQEPYSLD